MQERHPDVLPATAGPAVHEAGHGRDTALVGQTAHLGSHHFPGGGQQEEVAAIKLTCAQAARPATCGTEADAVAVPDGDTLQAYWLWSIKEALLDVAVDYFDEHLARRYRLTHRGDMQPGSGDAGVWAIERQKELFSLFGGVEGMIGVRLTGAMLMIPTMSVSGIVYPTETDFASCQVCHREACARRTAPFDEAVWQAACGD